MIKQSYQDILEKIIMNQLQLKKMCQNQIDNIFDRIYYLCDIGRTDDAASLYEEIQDWVIQKTDIEIMSLDYINGEFGNN